MRMTKKLYCRSLQKVFHLVLPVLPYTKPEQLRTMEELPKLLQGKKISKVLLITDQGIRGCGLIDPLEKLFEQTSIQCYIYDKTVANPTDQNVEEARTMYIENKCEAIIGFGGGSSMDCAKAVGARIARPKKELAKMEGILRVHKKLPLLIAIPTTSGTGSEVTLAAVITDSKTHHKYPISDFCLIPKYAVLDPKVTCSLPPFLTACTALDALTHAVEAYIGNSTIRETRQDAEEAVRLIFLYIKRAFDNGNDLEARENLSQAAYLAGNAFSKSYVGYVHAVAHSLSGKYNVPHGFANAVLLPNVLDAYGMVIHKKLARLAVVAGLAQETDSDSFAAAKFIKTIREMNRYFGIPTYIKEIKKEDIKELAKTADKEANPLYPVPKLMDAKQLEGFYETVREGYYERTRHTAHSFKTEKVLSKWGDLQGREQNLGTANS